MSDVYYLLKCDFCNKQAKYDARIPLYASWGYTCELHFKMFECQLGIGKGQKLEVKEMSNDDKSV